MRRNNNQAIIQIARWGGVHPRRRDFFDAEARRIKIQPRRAPSLASPPV